MGSLFLALQICFLFGTVLGIPTCSQVQDMAQTLRVATAVNPGYRDSLPALFIRLGFHDCVGGCNGCINFNNPDNNGLQLAVSFLTNLYNTNGYKSLGVSLADYFALAATVGVTIGLQVSNALRNGGAPCTPQSCPGPCPMPCFNLTWGRQDVADCSTTEPPLPSPKMTGAQMYAYFNATFGFNKQQVVALMGAHGLGGAHRNFSGYAGKWTGPQSPGFSEAFYMNFINKTSTWALRNADPKGPVPKWEYQGQLADKSDAGFMLNTDMELFYDLTVDTESGKPTCLVTPTCGFKPDTCAGSCPVADTFNQAVSYSTNCPLFMADFVDVFTSMLNNGSPPSSLQSTAQCCSQ